MPEKKSSIRKALVLSFAQKYTGLALTLPSVIILSRILTPKEIGVYSVAAGLTALATIMRTFGVSEYLVQSKTVTEAMIRTSFTVNLMLAWFLALVLFVSSWQIGIFYDDPGVGRVARVLSGTFVLVPFGVTATALLQRDLAFSALYKIRTVENVVRTLLTVGLAFAGFSYMSMAWGSLASMMAMVLSCSIWGQGRRARGLSLVEWRRMLPFGAKLTASNVAVQLGEQSANIVVGKMLGMAAAGFYSRGYGLVNIFRDKVVSAISDVAFPAFAAEHRDENAAPRLFIKSLVYLTGISWPFFAFAALMAFPIIRIMFGNQWDAAVPLMRWLCGAAIVGTLIYQCNDFLVAVGRVGAVTKVEMQYQFARLVLAIAAAWYSLEAVAASQVLVYAIAVGLYHRNVRDFEQLSFRECAKALVPSAWVTVTSCVVPAIVLSWPGFLDHHLYAGFAMAILGGGAGWLFGIFAVKHPLLDELQRVKIRVHGYFGALQKR
ncbi:MAG TPA: lipopolysaccharide biosynthesis protein [Rhodanobacteraceae bacterium]